MKKSRIVLLVIFLLGGFSGSLYPENMRVGIIEFTKRNDIGLQNAEQIIPELLADKLAKIGKYTITERVLLKKVLEEQELGLSGVIDTKTAPKVGKIYGLDGVVIGSFMKLGDKISINARLIDSETGKILHSGTVTMESTDELEDKIEVLAYLLSGISHNKMKYLKDMEERKKRKYAFMIGGGVVISEYYETQVSPSFVGFYYQSSALKLLFSGIVPLFTNPALIYTGIDINISPYFSIGGRFNFASIWEDINYDNITQEKLLDSAEYKTFVLGFTYSPFHNLNFGFYIGPMINAEYRIATQDGKTHIFEVKNFYNFPACAVNIEVEYLPFNNFGFMFLFTLLSAQGKNKSPTENWEHEWIESKIISLGVVYRFSVKK